MSAFLPPSESKPSSCGGNSADTFPFLLLRRRRTGQVTQVGSEDSRQRKEVMSQNTARHDPHAKSRDEDIADPQARRPEHKQPEHKPRQPENKQGVRPRQLVGQPAGDGGVEPDEPDEPDEGEFELIGDNDLGAADLGPAAPNTRDPDAGSGRIRKIR
jgi:hypothetical protein